MKKTRKSKTPPVGERIIAELEAKIIGGIYQAGDRIPTEERLVALYAASRAAVREAVQVLKARGLVVSRRGSGSYVAADAGAQPLGDSLERYAALRSDAQTYLELLDLRLMVESFCVRQLALKPNPAALARMHACMERMRAAKEDLRRFGEEDISFHQSIVEGAGHLLFGTIYRGLMPHIGRRFAQLTYTDTALVGQRMADHGAILQAIADGDAAGAEACLRTHLISSRENFEKTLDAVDKPV
ncbi:MAG: FCD domain-containing protein [Verrucomicrobia bacterium]|nr:FCD domain-containing protein [Verrucomicrobiota bacterium]